MADARENRRIGNLVTVEVQDRQHGAIPHGIDELVRMPRRGERSRLGLAIADYAGHDQIWIVEHGAIRMREAVAEFTALVNRAGRFGRHMGADMPRKRELLEELLHA